MLQISQPITQTAELHSNLVSFSQSNSINFRMYEFFCGHGEVSRAFESVGFSSFKIDKRKRAGKCIPDMRADILKINSADLPYKYPGVLWAAVPCDAFSNAAGNYYRDGNGYKETTKYFNSLLKKTLKLIVEISPALYFIENPRGSLRYNKLMIDFLAETSGTIKECTLGSYGFPTTKPTDIFTNYQALQLHPLLPFGRGAKCSGQNFNNLTKSQRQSTPYALGLHIATQVLSSLNS